MSNKFHFTFASIRDLPFASEGKRLSFQDIRVSNLELRITSKKKTFYCRRWIAKRQQTTRIRLGDYPALTVEQARKQALEAALQISKGSNLVTRQSEKEITFGELFSLLMETEFKIHCKPKTCVDYEWLYKCYLSRWENAPISQIGRQQIHKLHIAIGKMGKFRTANRALAFLHTFYKKALERNLLPSSIENPINGIKRYREQSRDRFLQASELGTFFKAVREEQNENFRDYFLLSIFTGVRKSNLLNMVWKDIDLEQAVWNLRETKNGLPQKVVLAPEALSILRERLTRNSTSSPFVFPSDSVSSHLCDPKSGWKRILKRSGLTDLRIHDLRRTFGSWQAATGASLVVIGKSLNHKSHSSTQVYARLDIDPVRESVKKATSAIVQAANGAHEQKRLVNQ